MEPTIKVGDSVYLFAKRQPNPVVMTVIEVLERQTHYYPAFGKEWKSTPVRCIRCFWFNCNNELQQAEFPYEVLRLA